MPRRIVMGRYVLDPAKNVLRPNIWATAEWASLAALGVHAHVFSPPHNASLVDGSPVLTVCIVPLAQMVTAAPIFTALDALPNIRVMPRLLGTEAPSGSQRTALRNILNAFGIDGQAASQASADFGDFLRFVLVNAWQNTEFDKAAID